MHVAEHTDRGIQIVAAETCGRYQRPVPNVAAHLTPRGIETVDAGGAAEFTSQDQSYPQLRALFADETGWVQPGG